MDKMKHRRLQELDESDFEIVKGEPDIRGWDVRNGTGAKIGEVEELIIDAQQKKVRYMVVDVDNNELKLVHRKVLLPIGLAQLHQDDDDVIIPAINVNQLNALPVYDRDNLSEEIERTICTTLGRTTSTTTAVKQEVHDADFYQHDYFNDDNLYKNRLHEAKPATETKNQSEFEQGLKLWELRSEGGILADDVHERNERRRQKPADEKSRLEMVRNRRRNYEDHKRSHSERNPHRDEGESLHRRDNSIIGRLRDEGLQDG